MALTIGFDQKALHVSSKDAMSAIRGVRPWYSSRSTEWRAPTFRTAKTKQEEPIIPPSSLFRSLEDAKTGGDTGPEVLPSVAQCAVHLELLQTLHALRVKVLRSTAIDATFDIKPNPRTVTRGWGPNKRNVKLKDDTFAIRRKEKWPLFVDFAVVRFQIWVRLADSLIATSKKGNHNGATSQGLTLPPLGECGSIKGM